MDVANIRRNKRFFKVLQTTKKSQTATMRLAPGEDSGPKGNEHPRSDQVLLVVKGQIVAEIGTKKRTLKAGDAVIVPAGRSHRFSNKSNSAALTFNVYAPPAYDPDEEE